MFLSTVAPSGDRDQDHFDFAIVELPSGLVNSLGPVRYVREHELQSKALPRAWLLDIQIPKTKRLIISDAKSSPNGLAMVGRFSCLMRERPSIRAYPRRENAELRVGTLRGAIHIPSFRGARSASPESI
jgi:hypothetical protein